VLALCTLALPKRLRRPAKNHLVTLLLATWGVYIYRDLWPLATYTLHPIDPKHWTTWTAIGLLTVVGIFVPFLMPHEYVPVEPENPYKEVNPEQTASCAANTEHLDYEKLPPLADYDAAAFLTKKSFPYLDPMLRTKHKNRHLAWSLLAYFHKEFIALAVLIFIKVVVGFAGPLGINRLLTYIETGGKDAVVRPWVWISWLLIGPLVGSTAMQWYIFINTRTLVRIECIITQLVFEHSLRIRMKEEVPTAEKPSEGTTAVPTPESASQEATSSERQDSEATQVE
ncbi:15164_t:CDS:2, partial [Acaulospora colombiana]